MFVCAVVSISFQAHAAERTFSFVYEVEVAAPRGQGPVDIFVPIAQSDRHQTILDYTIESTIPGSEATERGHGNRFWHGHLDSSTGDVVSIAIRYTVRRTAFEMDWDSIDGDLRYTAREKAGNQQYLEANRRVPVSGSLIDRIVADIAPDETNVLKIARATYDFVIDEMEYKKIGEGWGNGDTDWACSAKYGNCTDFHALFNSLIRARGIPSRFEIGFLVHEDLSRGSVGSYHCWVEFYMPGEGWLPIDAAAAKNQPDKRDLYFGGQPADRIMMTVGRDLDLGAGHTLKPLNYFVYPHVEVAGKLYKDVKTHLSYTALTVDGVHVEDRGEPTLEEVAQVIEAYVERDSKLKGGYFLVYDDKADKPLRLQLDKVHRERLSKIHDGLYFVCADFKNPEGTVYDLDFWMRGTSKEDLHVSDAIAVHKINGERRYYWSLNAESNLWEQKPIKVNSKSM
jgi:transglutaminase-like putative cysteine protease